MSPRSRPSRPGAGESLVAAMAVRGGPDCDVRVVASRSWASATFEGARHRLEIRLPSRAAVATFEDGLTDAEFSLRGHLLADIAVAGRSAEGTRTVLQLEALTIEEAGL